MSFMQLSEGGFQVVYPLGLWYQSSGVVKSYIDMASKLFTFTFTHQSCMSTLRIPVRPSGDVCMYV